MNFHLVHVSDNRKIGKISVTYTSSDSCPPTCKLKNSGCYGESGPIALFWKKVDSNQYGTSDFNSFCNELKNMNGLMVRINSVGDLGHTNGYINTSMLEKMTSALKKKIAFTYTHHDMTIPENRAAIKKANDNGFTINLSADNLADVDQYVSYGIGPVVSVIPEKSENVMYTPGGNKIVKCPASYKENVTCQSCKLCTIANRKTVIGFPAHGTKKKAAEMVFNLGK